MVDQSSQDGLNWLRGAEAFPEQRAEALSPIGSLVDQMANHWMEIRMTGLEAGDLGLLRSCIVELGQAGLLAAEVPEERGGVGLSMMESCRIVQGLGPLGGLSVAYIAHSGLATTPLAIYANDVLANTYLPRLMSGEWIGAYCLTEPGSGSDAQAACTRAVRVDGGWQLSGTKAWISNGGIADLFIVFAHFIEGEASSFGACVVERSWAGVTPGSEEHKLGMRSSSTTTVTFDDVFVPHRNIIGEISAGARIAFGTLNAGRLKVGAVSVGACRDLLQRSLAYAEQRIAFGAPITELPAVREKLAVMAARTFALEATVYRIAAAIDQSKAEGMDRHGALAAWQAEVALVKVLGSETLAYCADEAIQIHGGNGFSEDYAPARAYRDARVQRIYEGTNEINRAHAARVLLKRWTISSERVEREASPQAGLLGLAEAVLDVCKASGAPNAAAAGPVADLVIAALEAESATLRARHAPHQPDFAGWAELTQIEAERRAVDAFLRLEPSIKKAVGERLKAVLENLVSSDRDAVIAKAMRGIEQTALAA